MSIRVDSLPAADAHVAISAAFQELALVHRLMSFHEPASDLSRVNREGSIRPVEVHPHTFKVLKQSIAISAATEGSFDVSVGAELVRWGWLPRPTNGGGFPRGTWRDIELHADRTVSLRRPVWIDLGGIAKGYAVDCATECLRARGVTRAVVNAGGDMRVLGKQTERIALGLDFRCEALPVVELADGSIASSSGHRQRLMAGCLRGPHVDGTRRTSTTTGQFACVLAEECVIADALTKVVLASGPESAACLRRFGASAYLFQADMGWQPVNSGLSCV